MPQHRLNSRLTFTIDKTWHGQSSGPGPWPRLTLESRGEHLHLSVEAPFRGDPPPPDPPGPTDRLWDFEVVELFVVGPGDEPLYTEIEMGPHGHHLLLLLRGVRRIVAMGLPLAYRAQIEGATWRAEALLPGHLLPPTPHRLNAFAIHGVGSERRYLAAHPVPGPEPDFHRLHLFPPTTLPGPEGTF